jgi:hypothetical protein
MAGVAGELRAAPRGPLIASSRARRSDRVERVEAEGGRLDVVSGSVEEGVL